MPAFAQKKIVGVAAGGVASTRTYAEWADRVRRAASALDSLGVSAGGRPKPQELVATVLELTQPGPLR